MEPSEFVSNAASHASELFSFILNESALMKMFMATTINTPSILETLFKDQVKICKEQDYLLIVQCDRGHPAEVFVSRVVRKILNVGFKNFVSKSNYEINSNRKREHECNREECSAFE